MGSDRPRLVVNCSPLIALARIERLLTLARRLGAMAVLDDREARRCATALAIPRIGTLGLLLVAKKSGYVVSVKPLIEELIRARIFLGIALVKRALLEAGEQ